MICEHRASVGYLCFKPENTEIRPWSWCFQKVSTETLRTTRFKGVEKNKKNKNGNGGGLGS